MAGSPPGYVVRVSDDKLSAYLEGRIVPSSAAFLTERIYSTLVDLGIQPLPSKQQLLAKLKQGQDPRRGARLVLVSGQQPVPPEPGHIEWAREFFDPAFVQISGTDRVDYRRRAGNPSVSVGDLLATLHPPIPGKPGVDVFGKPIAPPEPSSVRVRAGRNVTFHEDRAEFRAAQDGRVRWANDVLSVDHVFRVQGDVGMASGDIDHAGILIVSGSIRAGAKVNVGSDAEIGGEIEAADVSVGGNLDVNRGITGNLKTGDQMIIKGALRARFMADARIEVDSDATIEKEVFHSQLKAGGAVCARRGRVLGGEVQSGRRIEVYQAGSEAGIKTVLKLVPPEDSMEPIRAKEKQAAQIRENIEKIVNVINPLLQNESKLSEEQAAAVGKLTRNAEELGFALKLLDKEIKDLSEAVLKHKREAEIVVLGKAYPETVFLIGKSQFIVSNLLQGPFRAVVNDGKIAIVALRPGSLISRA
ncbi:MAG: DUF342 domain-containing protein, partial [Candidatus Hydrogenedentes bacterium]|nr:DUF342 domain-containing protein [Candidatus Hydrogenedentota bacterium]